MLRIASIGECMIELSEIEPGLMRRSFGGDTLNTAVYLARGLDRATARVSYVTALGDDRYSDEMIAGWQAEGVDTSLVTRIPGRLPGLHTISTDVQGERSFSYWREQAAVRDLLAPERVEALSATLAEFDLVYLSGITLAIFDQPSRRRLQSILEAVRAAGGEIAFDPNYRPRLWPDAAVARDEMARIMNISTKAFPTFDDEAALCGDASPECTGKRLQRLGVDEIVVKLGADGCIATTAGSSTRFVPERVVEPVDTTGAGDSFNAGYLTARLTGATIEQAVRNGQQLAARVVGFRGAIIPR